MTATATTTVGTCPCGATVSREIVTGFGADMLNKIPFRCEGCEAALEQERAQADAAAAAAKTRSRIEAQLPRALRDIDLDRLDPAGCADAIGASRTWARAGGGLLMTGDFGVGKTTIAAGAFRLRLQNYPGYWLSAPQLMARLGSGFGTPAHDQAVKALTGRGSLALDDLDKTRPTAYGAEQIFLAIDSAVTGERAFIATTNLDLDELANRWPEPYGEAIVSRIVGYCKVVVVTGHDRRLTGPVDTTCGLDIDR